MSQEIWKPIPGYSKYFASDLGNILSYHRKNARILRPGKVNKWGHQIVSLHKNKISKMVLIHRLILITFIGNCPKGHEGSHINGRPWDNKLENLIWETRKQNVARKKDHGTLNCMKGEDHPLSKLTEEQVLIIRKMYKTGLFLQREIGKIYGVSKDCIGDIIRRKKWRHI